MYELRNAANQFGGNPTCDGRPAKTPRWGADAPRGETGEHKRKNEKNQTDVLHALLSLLPRRAG